MKQKVIIPCFRNVEMTLLDGQSGGEQARAAAVASSFLRRSQPSSQQSLCHSVFSIPEQTAFRTVARG